MCCRESVFNEADRYLKINYPEIIVEWNFFENNMNNCLENVKMRNDDRDVNTSIIEMSKVYIPPINSIKVFKGKVK